MVASLNLDIGRDNGPAFTTVLDYSPKSGVVETEQPATFVSGLFHCHSVLCDRDVHNFSRRYGPLLQRWPSAMA